MHKLIVTLLNHSSPLEPVIFKDGSINAEIKVEDIHNTERILTEVEKIVETVKDRDKGTISISICEENGNMLFRGYVQNGSLSGTKMS